MSNVLIVGDWHGNTRFALRVLERARKDGISDIFHLGDFGVWPGPEGQKFLNELESYLSTRGQGMGIRFVDGNHEDFPQLYNYPINSDGFREVRPHIHHIPRGHTWWVDGRRWMGLGGATSLDRPRRIPGVSWWPEEELTVGEAYRAAIGPSVDVMLTHDCPDRVEIPGLGQYSWPHDELIRAEKHRERVSMVVDELRPYILFHGHFHRRYNWHRISENGHTTKIVGLDCDGGTIEDNAIVFDTESLRWHDFGGVA